MLTTLALLLKTAALIRERYANAQQGGGADWTVFVQSEGFIQKCVPAISELLERLSGGGLLQAYDAVDNAERELLHGRQPSALSQEELAQYRALVDLKLVLAKMQVAQLGTHHDAARWLIDNVAPVLERAGGAPSLFAA